MHLQKSFCIYIFPPGAPGPVAGENVTFDASASFDPDWGNITSYNWSFNLIPRTGPVCTYIFPNFGNANVALTLIDTESETSSPMSLQVRVYARPNATFTVNPTESDRYVGHQLIFDASNSYDPDNNTGPTHGIATYTWNFGDGPPLVTYQNTTSHTYSTNNTYPVNLTVTDYDNLTSSSYAKSIYIGSDIPKANFTVTTPSPYYVNDNLTFDASNSTPDGGNISSYNWNWNDTTTDNTTMPVIYHSFRAEGLYNVSLIVMDTDNKTSAPFMISVPVRLPVLLKVSNSTGGNILTADPPTGTFNVSIGIVNVKDLGYFKFTLRYQNESSPLLKYIQTYPGNFSLFTVIPDPQGGSVQVVSYSGGGGNGNFTLAIIAFAVTNPGNCTLYLSLSDYMLLNSTNGHIYVDVAREGALNVAEFLTDKPFADFTYVPSTPSNITTTVFNASRSYDPDNNTGPTHGIATYTWNFGDGSTPTNATSPITSHLYQNPGNYTVTLNVTDYTSETWWANYTLEVFYGRDVGVAQVAPCIRALNTNTSLYETAGILPISVTVVNDGTAGAVETFNVTVYFDAFSVETEVFRNLAQGDNRTILFNCRIRNVPIGVYNISAYAGPVPDETNPSNNNYTDGSVRVYLQGDVNRDNSTDILDSILLSNAMNSKPGEGNWNLNADLDCDGQVNILDAIILANGFSLKLP